MEIQIQVFKSPVGELTLGSIEGKLCLADWTHRKQRKTIDARVMKHSGADFVSSSSPVIDRAVKQLNEYFAGQRQKFSVPLKFFGTEFQCEVWTALTQIAFGTTTTYLGLAKQLNKASAVRAVAAANGANALSIFVPCHRVIGSKGELTGYAGGLKAKRQLLKLEGVESNATKQLSLFD